MPSFLSELFPPATKFTADDVPDMTGKVVIVTGGNAGIGKECTKILLGKNAKVYIASRDEAKAKRAIEELKGVTGKEALFLRLDLANLRKVKTSAEEFLSKESELHVLFNNAGVMSCPIDYVTDDGYDMQFGTNVLGHFYFTKLLLPVILSTAEKAPKGSVRVVNVASNAHLFSDVKFELLKDSPARRKRRTELLYGQSKTGNILLSNELARRYGHRIVSISLNPGAIKTELQRHSGAALTAILNWLVLKDVSFGPLTQLYAGTSPEAAAMNGKYLIPWARVGAPAKYAQDSDKAAKLWDWLEEQVKDI
ncbi:NAD(P)-binding protein [Coniophora puteana RWD-64-598 SS2]|uniref:NAD(P)-binding protein n=1 Tax=Coniophora puteana (strain RWD-64-598) TaxID=741705 RepID=R7SD32_CONPW|nr:NAD(P)-binding protein [Coniophora puteana RWD-64-598 SS2]EIW74073.1 NAD(P)-binding protein [Coniophora puteana RWD-64-598 SS2]